jgi:hypothetical protein
MEVRADWIFICATNVKRQALILVERWKEDQQ